MTAINSNNDLDVLIIGAGISGIGAACHLTRECPNRSYAIVERRNAIGGTWDLFRYPGIRSDSDMCTFGYSFRPWAGDKVLADGPSIKRYVEDTAREYDVDRHIRFGRKVKAASWSSEQARWNVELVNEATGEPERIRARFLLGATGYYNYDKGYKPEFVNEDAFKGQIVHPQFWPEDLNYDGRRVVVIGSGATAITLVPSMSDRAEHVTMLQRSPTYVMTVPAIDPVSARLRRVLPDKLVYRQARTRNIGLQRALYTLSKAQPKLMRRTLLGAIRKQLGDNVDMKHFSPRYDPWDQRLCVVPDGDLFKVLKDRRASIVTDEIEAFTETGLRLKSGQEIQADIVVTATGLELQTLGGVALDVDGQAGDISKLMTYKGVMVEGVPNMAFVFGYTNSSWTLKADLASEYVCRVLNHMEQHDLATAVPVDVEGCRLHDSVNAGLSSGYITRAAERLPRQGSKRPWKVVQDYLRDIPILRHGPVDDGVLRFTAEPLESGETDSRRWIPDRLFAPLRGAANQAANGLFARM